MTARNGRRLLLIPMAAVGLSGCESPEFGRPRGGGHGGDGGNYVRTKIHPSSKIDATKDLGRIDHHGPGPSDWR